MWRGAKRAAKGGKVTQERITVGLLLWNAIGPDFLKPIFFGKANRPRCFGKHLKVENIGTPYYTATTKHGCELTSGRMTVLKKFNAY